MEELRSLHSALALMKEAIWGLEPHVARRYKTSSCEIGHTLVVVSDVVNESDVLSGHKVVESEDYVCTRRGTPTAQTSQVTSGPNVCHVCEIGTPLTRINKVGSPE